MLDYKGDIGIQYNPCAVAQYGLGCLQSALHGNISSADRSISCAEWLVSWAQKGQSGWSLLPYFFDINEFGLKAPFFSGIAQANAVSFLLRMSAFTGDRSYHAEAERLFKPLLGSIDSGGFSRPLSGNWIIEEFVMDRPSGVLDGWLYAIIAIRDMYMLDSAGAWEGAWHNAITSLEAMLPRYDIGYWSATDIYALGAPMPSSHFYHKLHVLQLDALAEASSSEIIKFYAARWRRQWQSPIHRQRAWIHKAWRKVVDY
jgi:heparosan-N-sulfate-glucuronate 5-epimerase